MTTWIKDTQVSGIKGRGLGWGGGSGGMARDNGSEGARRTQDKGYSSKCGHVTLMLTLEDV
jgi:hypothetical protein